MRALIPNSTQIPDVILDHWMADLSGAEFKVLMYIARRTYGFGKEGDSISLKQIVSGMAKRDGTVVNRGTGLNKDTVCKALASLESQELIMREQRTDEVVGDLPNFYRLNLDAPGFEPEQKSSGGTSGPVSENPTRGRKNFTPGGIGKSDTGGDLEKTTGGSRKIRQARVGKSDTQETLLQETLLQETTTTPDEPGDGVVVFFTSFYEEGMRLLTEAGFSFKAANELVTCDADGKGKQRQTLENIKNQLEWLPKRKAADPMAVLRRSLEEHWTKPTQSKAEQQAEERERKRRQREAEEATKKARAEAAEAQKAAGLRVTLDQLEKTQPEAFTAFLAFVDQQKEKELNRPLAGKSEHFRKMVERSYQEEGKRLDLLAEFLKEPTVLIPPELPTTEYQSAAS